MTKKRTDIVNLRLWSGLFCIVVSFVFFAQTASAQVVIDEVQISPIGERFIELYNSGGVDIDLTGWYIQRRSSTSGDFGSLVTSTQFKDKVLKANKYFLISRSSLEKTDIIVGDITLTAGNTILIKNSKKEIIDQVEWSTIDDGKSYQRTSANNWVIADQTPGSVNSSQVSDTTSSETPSSPTVTSSSASDSSSYFDTTMYTRIVIQSGSSISGAPIFFTGEAVDAKKKQIDSAYYLWAFGDGETGSGKTVSHIFRYPGGYIVTLTVSSAQGATSVTTTTKITISPALLRASVYEEGSSAVAISNDGSKDVDLSSWSVDVGSRRFTIPEHTILSAYGTIILAPETTGFHAPLSFVNIYYPNGKPYEQAKKELPIVVPVTQIAPVEQQTKASVVKSVSVVTIPNTTQQTVTQDQGASVSDAFDYSSSDSSPSQKDDGLWLWYTSAALLGAVALLGLRFTRNSEVKNTFTADDFKISEVTDEIPDDEYGTDEPH